MDVALSVHLFAFLCMAAMFATSSAMTYNATGQNLTAVPYDINENVTELLLQNNLIQDTEALALRDLPDLDKLVLDDNSLTSFPDLTPLGDTLTHLSLSNNKIRFIPTESMLPLRELTTLEMDNNPISTLPNFGLLPLSSTLDVYLDSAQRFVCDWRMTLVKKAVTASKVTLNPDPTCGAPTELDGLAFSSVTEEAMMTEVNATSSYGKYVPFDASLGMHFYPNINATVADVTTEQCASRCLALSGCTMFAFDSGSCTLTDLGSGTSGAITGLANWHARV